MSRVRTRGIDHFGLTVARLNDAIGDLRHALEGGVCYIEGPITDKWPSWMAEKLGARGSFTLHVAAVGAHGVNLELFEYDGDGPQQPALPTGRPGTFTLLRRVPDPQSFIRTLRDRAEVMSDCREGTYEVHLASGIPLAVLPGTDALLGGMFLTHDEFSRFVAELRSVFGLTTREEVTAYGAHGVVLAGEAGAAIAVFAAGGRAHRPANSDIGGHHIAFHADDVDASRAALIQAGGFIPLGEPETITSGPIAGDRWNYVVSPSGVQLELINMPDGALPYEETAERLRTPITAKVTA